jgi:hypothetical protein
MPSTYRVPTEHELAGALAYCDREFSPCTDADGNAAIRSEDLAEGLAFGHPDRGTFGTEYIRAARETIAMHNNDHWIGIAACADRMRADQGMPPMYRKV